jgi:hypothetical protein
MRSSLKPIKARHERGWHRLFYTGDGDLDLSWILVVVFAIVGLTGFLAEAFSSHQVSTAAWSWLGGSFLSIVIAAVPIAKARLLANSKSLGDLARSIASAGGNIHKDDERDAHWNTKDSDATPETGVGSKSP